VIGRGEIAPHAGKVSRCECFYTVLFEQIEQFPGQLAGWFARRVHAGITVSSARGHGINTSAPACQRCRTSRVRRLGEQHSEFALTPEYRPRDVLPAGSRQRMTEHLRSLRQAL
jgi:hypothetical protein